MTPPALRYLSLGAGRQSTALFLMCCDGVFGDERPTVAIFADTQDEPADVYRHLDRLERDFGHVLPIRRVTAGKLSHGIVARRGVNATSRPRFAAPPFYVRSPNGAAEGMLRRQCTREFKIEPIEREVRALLGVAKGRRVPRGVWVEAWQGISRDEAMRMKDNRRPWMRNRYPLVFDRPMTARDCEAHNTARGYSAAKSACVFCPYTDDARWREMKANRPAEFAEATRIDRALRQPGALRAVDAEAFVHRSLVPLDEVDFSTAEEHGQINMFENECEGMCGV